MEHAGYFEQTNHGILDQEKVSVFVNDGRQHLRMQPPNRYDLITLEPPPLAHAGVAALYSKEFYELVKSRLKPGGFITQWLPIRQLPEELTRSVVRTMLDLFPETIMFDGDIGVFILMGRKDRAITVDPADLRHSSMSYVRRAEAVTLIGLKLHVLAEGSHFNVETREATID